jgi:hypothetical protein
MAEGCYYKSPCTCRKRLTEGVDEKKAARKRWACYLDEGFGRVNPYIRPGIQNLGQSPRGLPEPCENHVKAGARVGCTDMSAACGGFPHFRKGRFRSTLPHRRALEHQLDATAKFLRKMNPALKANGVCVCVETHEGSPPGRSSAHRAGRAEYVSICYDVGSHFPARSRCAAGRIAPT